MGEKLDVLHLFGLCNISIVNDSILSAWVHIVLIVFVNLSVDGAKGPVDIWHYDSIAYTGVVLLNKVDKMEGGKLEIMHHNKHHALELLAKSHDYKCEAISYEKAGKMILAQGSEILHHVTPVLNDSKR